VGLSDGSEDGKKIGELDGCIDGAEDGCELDLIEGNTVGFSDDLVVGVEEG